MKNVCRIIVFFVICIPPLSAQSMWKRSLENHRHGLVLSTNTAISGSAIDFRPGLGIGYTYFGNKFNVKGLTEYSQWRVSNDDFTLGEFRLNFRYEYERYINNWFSVGSFMTQDIRYNEDYYSNTDSRNRSEVTYALGLGLSPKIYHLTEKYYLSLGLDLPLIETGYFQGDGPDPDAGDISTFEVGLDTRLFSTEVRAVATFGYRF